MGRSYLVVGVFLTVVVGGAMVGSSLMNQSASVGGQPKYHLIAQLVDDSPTDSQVVDSEDSRIRDNELIQRAIETAAEDDRFVKIQTNESQYDTVRAALDHFPAYESSGEKLGLLVEYNGTVVRVYYTAAIPA